MTFADRAKQAQVRKGPACTVGLLLAAVDPKYAAEVRETLGDRSIPATVIARLLNEDGYPIKDNTIQRHRKRGTGNGCECPL